MAMRSTISRVPISSTLDIAAARWGLRSLSDASKGKVLSEEERAAENVYIQKMEREKMEKARKKAEEEENKKAESEKHKSSSPTEKAS